MFKYQPGDVLVQVKGEPWVMAANILIGNPYPHARLVSQVDRHGVPTIIESGKQHFWNKAQVAEFVPTDLDNFIVLRPQCDMTTKFKAIQWARTHAGIVYAYSRLLQVGLGYRLGLYKGIPGMDDNPSLDNRPMICSELIAMAYYRSGYDLVPQLDNVDTLPVDFINNPRLIEEK